MITFENVTFRYGAQESNDTENTDSIRNLSFSVKSGECVILCGRSGSGKSTILRAVSGLIPIFFEGKLCGMDGDGVIRITEWVRTIANQNKIVIIITHDDLLIKMACDNIICLK